MFKVGDVVSYNDDAGNLILEYVPNEQTRVKLGCRGIITEIHSGGFYSVHWFGNGDTVNETLELNPCDSLCDKCKYRTECWK